LNKAQHRLERVVPTRAELDDLGDRRITAGQRLTRSDSALYG